MSVVLLKYLSENEDETAAATLVSTYANTVSILFMSPLFAVAIYLSGKLGEYREAMKAEPKLLTQELDEKKEIIASTNANALMIASAAAVPSTLLLYYSKNVLTSVFQQNVLVVQAAEPYLTTFAFASPGLLTRLSFEQVMFSFGKTKPAMLMGLANLGVGVVIALGLGFGLDSSPIKIPKWGAKGVALGFLIETYLTALAYGLYVAFNKESREFKFFNSLLIRARNNAKQRWDILTLGGSISFTVLLELGITLALGIFSGLVGAQSQAAMTYYMQFIYFQFIVLSAFSFSCAQEISRKRGSNRYLDAKRMSQYGLLTTVLWLTPVPLLFALYPKAISNGASSEISVILSQLVPIMSISIIFDNARYNLLQQLRAMNDLFVPNMIAFFGMSLGIALIGVLGLRTSLDINGVGIGYLIGVGLPALGLFLRWHKQIHLKNMEQQQPPALAVVEHIAPSSGVLSS
ncbi:MAG TPA: MATE family efflux transporter, partial [Coxiellaceae bacterium]|nr:MATE family efflux transporter [Coxiellaceae bacterium]